MARNMITHEEAKLWICIRARVVNIRNEALAGAAAEAEVGHTTKNPTAEHDRLRAMLLARLMGWTRPH
jgi:hypothetical protein